MSVHTKSVVMFALVLVCTWSGAYGQKRQITATRAVNPPVLDGRLDDACWRSARPIENFNIHGNKGPAKYKSIARIAYDDTNIYVAVKCLDPKPKNISAKAVPHDGAIFAGDVVEVMLAANPGSGQYIHLAANAADSKYDSFQTKGGAATESRWNGQWQAEGRIDKDGWTVEMAIPFASLNVSEKTNSTWGINICREKPKPRELSSILPEGTFNSSNRFASLEGLYVDFRRFHFPITRKFVSFRVIDGKPCAIMEVSTVNKTPRARQVNVKLAIDGMKNTLVPTKDLQPGKRAVLCSFPVAMEEMIASKAGQYLIADKDGVGKVTITDAKTGELLAVTGIVPPRSCKVLDIRFANPFSKKMISMKPASIDVEVDVLLTKKDSADSVLTVSLVNQSGKVAAVKKILKPKRKTLIVFPTKDLAWGAYTVKASYIRGKTAVEDTRIYALMPDDSARIKPLNNMVFELLNAKTSKRLSVKEFTFMNPRKGWVFFSLAAGKDAKVFLDGAKSALFSGKGAAAASEAMRLLPAGRHKLRIDAAKGTVSQLVVRAIPETIYSRLAFGPHRKEFGPYDWEFLWQDVLPNCTTILGHPRGHYTEGWAALGRGLVDEGPGHINMPKGSACKTEDFLAQWKKNAGLASPGYSGMFVDEFGGAGFATLKPIMDAMRAVAANPKYKGRYIAPWCYFVAGKTADFNHGSASANLMCEIVFRAGWPVAYEAYLVEAPVPAAQKGIKMTLLDPVRSWNRVFPDAVQQMVLTLEYARQFNIDPGVDFKVHMDMQFQAMANDPAFFGLYGVMEYISSWADRDIVRWTGALYRHYCIEGNIERLSKDPYALGHIQNPDFDKGLAGWTIKAAKADSIAAKTISGYGNFQGRRTKLFTAGWQANNFPAGWQATGDHVLLARRNAKKPNTFSQKIKGLQPGRLYSLTMFTGDYGAITSGTSKKEKHTVSISIENTEPIPGPHNSFTSLFRSKVTKKFPKFSHTAPYWFNFHWRVFRAKGPTAKLVVSDWKSPSEPGGPIGQELLYNFIEVQPHFKGKGK